MNIKNVVKVMNFHSLLRVERSRKSAKKYSYLGDALAEMIDNIVNNRNILMDYKILRVDPKLPVLNIYLGGDMGFCGNLNSSINRRIAQDEDAYKIIIGKKLRSAPEDDKVIFEMSREDYNTRAGEVFDYIEKAFMEKMYSQINLIYNHYYNSTEVEFLERKLFPMDKLSDNTYDEDFVYEGEIEPLLCKLIVTYMRYELIIASEVNLAALNITRQNTTSESLKKIDERDEAMHLQEIREGREKEFSKVLDNYTKLTRY